MLSRDAVKNIISHGEKCTDVRSLITCSYSLQIIENYYPQSNQANLDKMMCFYMSDGFTKIKGLFIKAQCPELVALRNTDTLKQFPILQITSYKIAGKTSDEFPILIMTYSMDQMLTKIVGYPIPYRTYALNGFENAKGALSLEPDEFEGLFDLIDQTQPKVSSVSLEQQPNIQTNLRPIQLQQQKQPQQEQLTRLQQEAQQRILSEQRKIQQEPKKQEQQSKFQHQQEQQRPLQMKLNMQAQESKKVMQINENKRSSDVVQQQDMKKNFKGPQPKDLQVQKQMKLGDFFPISMLNPKFSDQFRGRVVKIDPMRNYGGQNGKKEGRIFTLHIIDEQSMLSASFFDAAAERFCSVFDLQQVYLFKGAQIKPARNADMNRQNGQIPYDVSFDNNAIITQINDVPSIPSNFYKFIKIRDILSKPKDSYVDLIAVIKHSGQIIEFQPKNKDQKSFRRTIQVFDDSEFEIDINLYGNFCKTFEYTPGDIYIFKSLKISEYQGTKNLISFYNSSVYLDSNSKESIQLNDWNRNFKGITKASVSKVTSILQLSQECAKHENTEYYKEFWEIRALLVMLKNTGTLFYQSCTSCMKKVQQNFDHYYCASCNIQMEEPKYRYILTAKFADATGSLWATISDQQANTVIDVSALELKEMIDQNNEKAKLEAINKYQYKQFRVKLQSKFETYNDVRRIKHQGQSIVQVGTQDTEQLVNDLENFIQNI